MDTHTDKKGLIYQNLACDSIQDILKYIDRVSFKPYINFKQKTFHFSKQVPHRRASNLKKAKVPSSLKGKLGRVQAQKPRPGIIIRK